MRYAVFSDIHSNLEAYQAFLEDTKKEGINNYLCVGDIVGYGVDPHQCIELIKELKCPVVCGNHDWAAASKIGIEYFNYGAQKAILWTLEALDDIDKNYLTDLKLVYQESEFTLVHGSLDEPREFKYVLELAEAAGSIGLQKTPLCFIGHSHIAGIFYENKDGHIDYTVESKLKMDPAKRYLVNVGSVGQPRDGDWRSSYCIYDNEKKTLHIKRVEYDLKKAQEKILRAGLPEKLATRLARGR